MIFNICIPPIIKIFKRSSVLFSSLLKCICSESKKIVSFIDLNFFITNFFSHTKIIFMKKNYFD